MEQLHEIKCNINILCRMHLYEGHFHHLLLVLAIYIIAIILIEKIMIAHSQAKDR